MTKFEKIYSKVIIGLVLQLLVLDIVNDPKTLLICLFLCGVILVWSIYDINNWINKRRKKNREK